MACQCVCHRNSGLARRLSSRGLEGGECNIPCALRLFPLRPGVRVHDHSHRRPAEWTRAGISIANRAAAAALDGAHTL